MQAGYWLCCAALALPAPVLAAPGDEPHFSIDAKALYAQASAMNAPEGTEVAVLEDDDSYRYDASGGYSHVSYVVYKVLSQGGADNWSRIGADWEPWHQDRPVIRARVIQADGKVYELDPKSVADTPAAQDSSDVYSDHRVLRAPLPAVAPGSVVEEEVASTTRVLYPGSGSAARVYFGRSVPVQRTLLVVDAPAALPIHTRTQLLPGLKPKVEELGERRRWVFQSGPTAPLEPNDESLPPDAEDYPRVDVSSAADWAAIAGQYNRIVDGRIGQTDLHAQVERLVQGKSGRDERIGALLDFLDREIRYTGVEFGEAAIVPRAPGETLGSKYGDCKDKATLLAAMLRSAGIPAHLALLNVGSRQDIDPAFAAANFFDHVIVYVPGEQPLWIDATARYARLGHLPGDDQGRYALVVRDDGAAPQRIPEAVAQDNLLLEERTVELAEYGPARIVEVSHPHGSFDAMYRDTYADQKDKDTLKNLAEYMKDQYLAEGLDHMVRSDPADLAGEFRLELESRRAGRGYTDLRSAIAAIRVDGLFSSLPKPLKERAAEHKDGEPEKKRGGDWYLHLPYVTEWRYRIVPPAGFTPKALPADATVALGPGQLSERFSADPDGVVHATLRFDTVKRRIGAEEVRQMSTRIADLIGGKAIAVRYEPAAEALLRQGKAREAFQTYRDLIMRSPNSATQHLRRAYALLEAGFGEPARAEARLAVKLDPKSALAEAGLAHVLEHDLVGRQWRRGADFAAAVAAMRAASKLDPQENDYKGNLAVLLEYDAEGLRYGDGADLAAAIAQYATLTPAQLAEQGYRNNPAYTLFYAQRYAEARKELDGLGTPPEALTVAVEAALNGAPAAIARAGALSSDEEHVKSTLRTAGDMLKTVRLYQPAADLYQAGASGDTAIRTMAAATMLRKSRRYEELSFGDTPDGLVMRWLVKVLDGSLSGADYDAMTSRNLRGADKPGPEASKDKVRAVIKEYRDTAGHNAPTAMITDVMASASITQSEGNDTAGYRVTLHMPGNSTAIYYVVRENGKYRILSVASALSPLGLEALDRAAAGDLASARTLLDWARDQQRLGGGDDPLEGEAFPRLWTRNQEGDTARVRLAAAALLVTQAETAARGIAILESAGPGLAAADRTAVDLALAIGYLGLRDRAHALEAASRLAQAYPASDRAFQMRAFNLRMLGRLDEADQLCRQRMEQYPDSLTALEQMSYDLQTRGDYAGAYALLRKAVDQGKGGAHELNTLAWISLYFARDGGADVETAERAAQMSPHSYPVLHTLASVYADAGQTRQAREILLQAMEARKMEAPDASIRYVLGRLAEQYGESAIATENYKQIPAPAKDEVQYDSLYKLAQARLEVLSRTGSGGV